MDLLVYISPIDDSTERFISMLPTRFAGENMTMYHSLDELITRLRRPKEGQTILVLFAAAGKGLSDILSIRSFLEDMKIIIILPDRKRETIAKGYMLHPRFLTFADSDFRDIVAVINKMSMSFTSAGSRNE